MKSHEIDYKVIGHDIQLVEVELDPGETVIAEAGAMMYMEDGIEFDTKMGDGSNPQAGFFDKLLSAGSRMIAGESVFITHFTNRGFGKRHVAFSAPFKVAKIGLSLLETCDNKSHLKSPVAEMHVTDDLVSCISENPLNALSDNG